MSVLFISSSFFGYAAHIKKELETRHGKVFWYEDRPSISFYGKVKARLFPILSEKLAYRYFRDIANQNKFNDITEVFVIKGESLSIDSIQYLRDTFPNATFRLYFWDGYRNMPRSSPSKVDLFDVAMSFDMDDVKNDPRLIYRPLFFIPDYVESARTALDIDLLFVGTIHSDRYKFIKKIERDLEGKNLNFHKVLYCPNRLIYWARRMFDRDFWAVNREDFVFSPITGGEIAALIARSKAVLDIERSVQSGFTMRTLETLGSFNKLVTTNPNVVQADFYDSNNILVVDRDRPSIPIAFLSSPKSSTLRSVVERYSLAAWINEIFSAEHRASKR